MKFAQHFEKKRPLMAVCFLLFSSFSFSQELDDISPAMRVAIKQSFAQANSFSDRFDAEVWLVFMSTRIERLVKDRLERFDILKAVHANSLIHDIPVDIILSVIETESHFDRYALSPAGAQGLMQIMPFWKTELGQPKDNLLDIDTNIRYGSSILRHYINIEKGDINKALARYNGSRGKTIYPNKVLSKIKKYQ